MNEVFQCSRGIYCYTKCQDLVLIGIIVAPMLDVQVISVLVLFIVGILKNTKLSAAISTMMFILHFMKTCYLDRRLLWGTYPLVISQVLFCEVRNVGSDK